MNKSEPQIVFLKVANNVEAVYNKSNKTIQRSLMASQAKFEATWVSRHVGFQKWLATKCDTMDVWMTISNACMNDPNVSMCSKAEFFAGGDQSRKKVRD